MKNVSCCSRYYNICCGLLLSPQFSRNKTWWSTDEKAKFIQHCSLPPFETDIERNGRQYLELLDELDKLRTRDKEYLKNIESDYKERQSLYDYNKNENGLNEFIDYLQLLKEKEQELLSKISINRRVKDNLNLYGSQSASGYGIDRRDIDKANFLKLVAAYKIYDCNCMLSIAKSKYKNGIIASEEINNLSNERIADIFKSERLKKY